MSSARRLNLLEMPLTGAAAPVVNGRTLQVKIRPNAIVTIGITPESGNR